jgi:hypothetical protein
VLSGGLLFGRRCGSALASSERWIRRAVPLSLGLGVQLRCKSSIDTLDRFDKGASACDVAVEAGFALGRELF